LPELAGILLEAWETVSSIRDYDAKDGFDKVFEGA